jgi:very-short-patch-repair endonuclease
MVANGAILLTLHIKALGLPPPQFEHRFDDKRKWRFDFAWPRRKIAVEIDGGIWTGGRHTRGLGFSADLEKLNAAVELGWRVYRFTPAMVSAGTAAKTLQRVLTPRRRDKERAA